MTFFNQFPKTSYSVLNDGVNTQIVDLYRYVDVVEQLASDVVAYSMVDIIDGERPDNLSHRLYGTPDYYWTFFFLNDALKEGQGAWPLSDAELKAAIKNQYEGVAAYRFPYVTSASGDVFTIKEIPIGNERYLPYLHLLYRFDTVFQDGLPKGVHSKAKIKGIDVNLSQIFIDTTNVEAISDSTQPLTSVQTAKGKTAIFHDSSNSLNFTIRFINPHSPGDEGYADVEALRKEFQEALVKAAKALRSGYEEADTGTIEQDYKLWNYQYWKDASLAPYSYYNPINVDEEITEFESGLEATNYISNADHEIEENDERKRIKVISSTYIQSFVTEYKKLINE